MDTIPAPEGNLLFGSSIIVTSSSVVPIDIDVEFVTVVVVLGNVNGDSVGGGVVEVIAVSE